MDIDNQEINSDRYQDANADAGDLMTLTGDDGRCVGMVSGQSLNRP